MYPNGPISHERHHFVFFLEIEQSLQAELDADEANEEDEEDFSSSDDTSTEKHSDDQNNDIEDDDDDEFFLPTSSKNLPTASEICANASYNNKNTKKNNSTRQNTVTNLIKAKFNQKILSTQRRQTDETVGLDDDDEATMSKKKSSVRSTVTIVWRIACPPPSPVVYRIACRI